MRLVICLFIGALALAAQTPKVGIIDFYGVRKLPVERLRKALGVQPGDPLPASKAEVEERLETVPGVVRAQLEAVCCEAGKAILFVGIEEKGAPHFVFRDPPSDNTIQLPAEVVSAYHAFLDALAHAVRTGNAKEVTSRGYSLMADAACRTEQEKFLVYADKYFDQLKNAIHNAGDGEQRAVATYALGYSIRRERSIPELQYAMQDSDDSVRNNAMRALTAIAALAQRDPSLELKISPTWFIEMLNSILWTDRNKASLALAQLTESRDPAVLQQIREAALPSILEMARWNSPSHALPAYLVAGRVAGVPEEEILKAWAKGDRESVLSKLAKK